MITLRTSYSQLSTGVDQTTEEYLDYTEDWNHYTPFYFYFLEYIVHEYVHAYELKANVVPLCRVFRNKTYILNIPCLKMYCIPITRESDDYNSLYNVQLSAMYVT